MSPHSPPVPWRQRSDPHPDTMHATNTAGRAQAPTSGSRPCERSIAYTSMLRVSPLPGKRGPSEARTIECDRSRIGEPHAIARRKSPSVPAHKYCHGSPNACLTDSPYASRLDSGQRCRLGWSTGRVPCNTEASAMWRVALPLAVGFSEPLRSRLHGVVRAPRGEARPGRHGSFTRSEAGSRRAAYRTGRATSQRTTLRSIQAVLKRIERQEA